MTFYNTQHELYYGVDLHAKRMYTSTVDANAISGSQWRTTDVAGSHGFGRMVA